MLSDSIVDVSAQLSDVLETQCKILALSDGFKVFQCDVSALNSSSQLMSLAWKFLMCSGWF
jgi:hypothetical protein